MQASSSQSQNVQAYSGLFGDDSITTRPSSYFSQSSHTPSHISQAPCTSAHGPVQPLYDRSNEMNCGCYRHEAPPVAIEQLTRINHALHQRFEAATDRADKYIARLQEAIEQKEVLANAHEVADKRREEAERRATKIEAQMREMKLQHDKDMDVEIKMNVELRRRIMESRVLTEPSHTLEVQQRHAVADGQESRAARLVGNGVSADALVKKRKTGQMAPAEEQWRLTKNLRYAPLTPSTENAPHPVPFERCFRHTLSSRGNDIRLNLMWTKSQEVEHSIPFECFTTPRDLWAAIRAEFPPSREVGNRTEADIWGIDMDPSRLTNLSAKFLLGTNSGDVAAMLAKLREIRHQREGDCLLWPVAITWKLSSINL